MNFISIERANVEFEKLETHLRKQGKKHSMILNSPSYSWLSRKRKIFLKKFIHALETKNSDFTKPAVLKNALIDGKSRLLYEFSPADALVHRMFSSWANEQLAPKYSNSLYSYQKGKSWWLATQNLRKYLIEYHHRTPIKERGLFTLRRDIANYTDTIPLTENSPLWNLISEKLSISDLFWVKKICRPIVRTAEGIESTNLMGVPTGSPISCVLFNLYLMELDQKLNEIPGAFYARYGDDILFIHPSREICLRAEDIITTELKKLSLSIREDKSQNLFWTGKGIPDHSSKWSGSSIIEFLGTSIHFSGTIGLRKKRIDKLRQNLTLRFRAAKKFNDVTEDEKLKRACQIANWAITSEFKMPQSRFLLSYVTDRGQLKEVDDWIYRATLRTVYGSESKGFLRKCPPKRCRALGLPSLLHMRNQKGRKP